MARAKADPAVRVVVLTGAGDQAFCAGADLTGMVPRDPADPAVGADGSDGSDEYASHHLARGWLAELFEEMWHLGKPTIARVQGWAMAGGFGLALACDMVIASERARFGAPELNVGLWPYMVTVPMLRSMPPKKALELMLTSRVVGAEEAERIGFVTKVVPHDRLDAEVAEMAADPGFETSGRDENGSRIVLRCAGFSGDRGTALPPCHADGDQPDSRSRRGDRRIHREAAAGLAGGHRRHRTPTETRGAPEWRNEH